MKRREFLQCVSASLAALAARTAVARPTTPAPSLAEGRFIVHEWGTFLSVQGSDGATLGGMVDSEDALPGFVRERSLGGYCRSRFYQKAETPVTYFYSDRRRTVQVRVDMPEGLLTHWFPSVRTFGPNPIVRERPDGRVEVDYATRPQPPAKSFLDWAQVEVIPDFPLHQGLSASLLAPRPVARDDHWRFARETDAALVRIGPENAGTPRQGDYEKFLFYRGLGTFDLPLRTTCEGKTFLSLQNQGKEVLSGLHVIRVAKEGLEFARLADVAGESVGSVAYGSLGDGVLPLREGVARVKESVAASLVQAGLYRKEALAMVNTWEKSYFLNEGLRVLYLVPRSVVDRIFPLHVKPLPQELARVMIGRVEVLTPEREAALVKAVANLTSQHPVERKQAKRTLDQLGRIREPALHRIAAIAPQSEVRVRALELIRQYETLRI